MDDKDDKTPEKAPDDGRERLKPNRFPDNFLETREGYDSDLEDMVELGMVVAIIAIIAAVVMSLT